MNLHYKKEFANVLKNGTKKHTIRKYAIAEGTELKHVIYPYSAKREVVLENKCTGNQSIEITRESDYLNETEVFIDGRKLTEKEVQRLAWSDGFDNLIAFWMYFSQGFCGYVNHWTEGIY